MWCELMCTTNHENVELLCRHILTAAHCIIDDKHIKHLKDAQPNNFLEAGLNFTSFPNSYVWNRDSEFNAYYTVDNIALMIR